MCLCKTGSALLPLVLEVRIKSIIDQVSLMHSELTCHVNQVTHSLVEVWVLRNLSVLGQLLEVVEFGRKLKVVLGHFLSASLYFLALLRNISINALILPIEVVEIITKLLCHIRSLTKNFSAKSFNLLDLPWSLTVLLDWQVISKFVLILFL